MVAAGQFSFPAVVFTTVLARLLNTKWCRGRTESQYNLPHKSLGRKWAVCTSCSCSTGI